MAEAKAISRSKMSWYIAGAVLLGIVIGGYLFSESQPRSIIAVNDCGGTCYKANELLGLLASVGVAKFEDVIPSVVKETDKTIVIKHPNPEATIHYLVLPKKDIKNAGELSSSDDPYLIDAFSVMKDLINKEGLSDYRIITNGPGFQHATYLHFHLRANK